MLKFDSARTKKLDFFYLPTLIFYSFFTICQEVVEKVVYRKKWGVTDHLREYIAGEVKPTATSPICA